jgi:hypothetical protein
MTYSLVISTFLLEYYLKITRILWWCTRVLFVLASTRLLRTSFNRRSWRADSGRLRCRGRRPDAIHDFAAPSHPIISPRSAASDATPRSNAEALRGPRPPGLSTRRAPGKGKTPARPPPYPVPSTHDVRRMARFRRPVLLSCYASVIMSMLLSLRGIDHTAVWFSAMCDLDKAFARVLDA